MNKEEFIKGMKFLGIAYGKEYNEEECILYYDFLKQYKFDVFRNSIKNIIKKSKFVPKINEIIEECEIQKEKTKFEILEIMRKDGYFKEQKEYEKATHYLENGIIPGWFREDMKKYYNKQLLGDYQMLGE